MLTGTAALHAAFGVALALGSSCRGPRDESAWSPATSPSRARTAWSTRSCRRHASRVRFPGLAIDAARARARAHPAVDGPRPSRRAARARSSRSGIAKATGAPVAVVCTSGTAAAELFPAVSRPRSRGRRSSCSPPTVRRGSGAPARTRRSTRWGCSARYARAYLEPPGAAVVAADALAWRAVGREAVAACGGPQPGPVHVNCSFEEPLVPTGDLVEVPDAAPRAWPGRSQPGTARGRRRPTPREELSGGRRGGRRLELVDAAGRGGAPAHLPVGRCWRNPLRGCGSPAWALAAGQALLGRTGSSNGTGRRSCCRSAPRRRRARPRRSSRPPSGSSSSTCSTWTPTRNAVRRGACAADPDRSRRS